MNTIYRSNLFAAFFFAVYLVGSLILNYLYAALHLAPPLWLRQILQYLLLFALPTLGFMRSFGLSAQAVGLRRPVSPVLLPYTVLLAFLLQPPLMALSMLASMAFPDRVSSTMQTAASYPLPLILLSTAVLPAVFEEWVCRGLFLSGYRSVKPCMAALASALFFAVLHMDLQQAPYAFAFGFCTALLFLYTDSLLLPVLAHALINATQLVCVRFAVNPFPDTRILLLTALLCLPPLAALILRIRRYKPRSA